MLAGDNERKLEEGVLPSTIAVLADGVVLVLADGVVLRTAEGDVMSVCHWWLAHQRTHWQTSCQWCSTEIEAKLAAGGDVDALFEDDEI